MLTTFWSKPGILVVYGSSIDASHHQHHAIQLVWPVTGAVCQFNNGQVSGPMLISSQLEHCLSLDEGWLLLIEPQSELGQRLGEQAAELGVMPIEKLAAAKRYQPQTAESPEYLLTALFSGLGLDCLELGVASVADIANAKVADTRIQRLLSELDGCLAGQCLKPPSWRAAEVARQLALSESRFLHLFRQQMGIAWRPYLLWRRMGCAVASMARGSSATEAAYLSGFADSAHLSRTFRRQFGLSIRQAQALLRIA